MKNTKKGFTLVELLVVIAILAILATVAVVGYTSFIDKANLSNDQAAIAQMNTGLQAAAVPNGFEKPSDAIEALYSLGWNDGKFETYSSGFHYAYNPTDNKMYLLNDKDEVIYPETTDKSKLWGLYDDSPNAMIEGVTNYIAVTTIKYVKGFEDSFKGNTAYVLDLNGKYLDVGNEIAYTNVSVSNGIVVRGNVTVDETVKKYTKYTEEKIVDGTTYENMVFENYSVATYDIDKSTTFTNCVFYNCLIQFGSDITVIDCRFEGGYEGTGACLYYNPTSSGEHKITVTGTTFNNVHRAILLSDSVHNNLPVELKVSNCTFNGLDKGYAYIQYTYMNATVDISNCTFNALNQGVGIIQIHSGCAEKDGYSNIHEKITFTNNTIASDIPVEKYVDMKGVTSDVALALDATLTEKMK